MITAATNNRTNRLLCDIWRNSCRTTESPTLQDGTKPEDYPEVFTVAMWSAGEDGTSCIMLLEANGSAFNVSTDYSSDSIHFKSCHIHTRGEQIHGRGRSGPRSSGFD